MIHHIESLREMEVGAKRRLKKTTSISGYMRIGYSVL